MDLMSAKKSLPNFLICGVGQSGTSFLVNSLSQHPEVYLPKRTVPEPHFFLKSLEYEKGIDAYSDEWFSDVADEVAIGEKSVSYIFGGAPVAERIVRHLPRVKIIIVLRSPIERTWGHYRFTAMNGLEPLEFDQALKSETERQFQLTGVWKEIQPHNYTGRSMYAKQLREFQPYFDEERVLILRSDDITNGFTDVFRRIFKFLDVDPEFPVSREPPFNSLEILDPKVQFDCRQVFGDRFGVIVRLLRSRVDPLPHARNADERRALERLLGNLSHTPAEMSSWARSYLHDLFRDDVGELEPMVDFPVRDWGI